MKKPFLILSSVAAMTLVGVAAEKDAPDNTQKNERDRSGETQTPGDQSNSPEDLKITQSIRQAVVKDDSLSMTAKNVKIITSGGQVTLRGPVDSAKEKSTIAKLAQSAAPGAKIDNQLEVKPN